MRLLTVFVLICALGGWVLTTTDVQAQVPRQIDREGTDTAPEEPVTSGASRLPSLASADSVRTNIWLAEALMGEVAMAAAAHLPPAPAAVLLVNTGDDDLGDLFTGAASRALARRGYDLFLPDEDPARQAAVDYELSFDVKDVDLTYPDVGRTLGLWREWVAREMSVTALVEITEADSGRLLLSDRICRRFSDRVPSDDFDLVNSSIYDFTSAETGESGWHSRLEEIVVLGTLAGLVAVYFANTSN